MAVLLENLLDRVSAVEKQVEEMRLNGTGGGGGGGASGRLHLGDNIRDLLAAAELPSNEKHPSIVVEDIPVGVINAKGSCHLLLLTSVVYRRVDRSACVSVGCL